MRRLQSLFVFEFTPQLDLVEQRTGSIAEGVEVIGGILFVHGLASDLLGNHVSKNSQHGKTSVVDLGIKLAGLLGRIKDVSTKVTNAVVPTVLGSWQPGHLDESQNEDNLDESLRGNGENSIDSGGNIGELQVVGGGDVSIENNVVVVNDASNHGHHGNTSVLTLNSTTALKSLGLALEPAKRIKDTKRLSDTEFELVDHRNAGAGPAGLLGSRGKGSGSSGEDSGNSELHLGCWAD
mmetsp:Transcript_3599/g.7999  ORF Transcript_3599/g.7999 Transcript_3599/m.7999 type:complete len:237 (-) Transcript_3599:23-733(-)